VTNVFILDYEVRLRNWAALRNKIIDAEPKEKYIEIDNFWQGVPLSNHYLHPDFIKDWPNPWQLLSDNNYCYYARALGIFYTLVLLGITDIQIAEAKDDNSNDVVIVIVDGYILNYWPNSVTSVSIENFSNLQYLNIEVLYTKIN